MKKLFTLIKMYQLSPLTDERMRRNEEKREEKIRPPDSITKAAPKWSPGRPEIESGPPQNGVRAAPKWNEGALFSPHVSPNLFSFLLICERGEL